MATKPTLQEYRRKRDFRKTQEPAGSHKAKTLGSRFVIQKHDATRLHFDLRIEIDGVYKSWAVPKGPSLNPANKRLAVEVEDHPLDYGTFEGTIPEGEYGGGTVMVWDRGTFSCDNDPADELRNGNMKITFAGERMKGKWALVLMHTKDEDGKHNWLLIKEHDDHERQNEKDLTDLFTTSVQTSRSMDEIAEGKKSRRTSTEPSLSPSIAGAKKGLFPQSLSPQLATLVDEAPVGSHWVHEIKFDGYRILAMVEDGKAALKSRNGLDWTDQFRTVAKLVEQLPVKNAIIDGEVVILDDKGVSDFGALQRYVKERKGALTFFAFDLPYLEGYDLTDVDLLQRKDLLKQLLNRQNAIQFSEHIVGEGKAFFAQACKQGLEGIISKRADAHYHQSRTRDWVKVKCVQRQEFVIGGYTDPAGTRSAFGSLVLGYFDRQRLVYCGKVGAGFDEATLASVLSLLTSIKQTAPCFAVGPTGQDARGVHYVEPSVVCEVEFMAWTSDYRLRHPVFKGLRIDKDAKEIGREIAVETPKDPKMDTKTLAGIRISHPERLVYPESHISKLELATYFYEIADWLLPHVADRPLALVRCPQGEGEECFFQKNFSDALPDSLHSVDLGDAIGIGLSDVKGLVALAQFGVMEIHPWGCRQEDIEHPDHITFDLDPGPGLGWAEVVEGAQAVRDVLKQLGLNSWVKASGGKGLHICVPLKPDLTWDPVKEFCHGIATLLEQQRPDRYVSSMNKAKRNGRIFVDYLRNGRGATSVAAYSPRAREGAPVSVPVTWDEVGDLAGGNHFDLEKTLARVKTQKLEPWVDFFKEPQDLGSVLKQLQSE